MLPYLNPTWILNSTSPNYKRESEVMSSLKSALQSIQSNNVSISLKLPPAWLSCSYHIWFANQLTRLFTMTTSAIVKVDDAQNTKLLASGVITRIHEEVLHPSSTTLHLEGASPYYYPCYSHHLPYSMKNHSYYPVVSSIAK